MELDKSIECPKCHGSYFQLKREATYLYTYELNSPESQKWVNDTEVLPYLFDNREQVDEKKYLTCMTCGSSYPCSLDKENGEISFTILRKALRSDFQEKPEYFG